MLALEQQLARATAVRIDAIDVADTTGRKGSSRVIDKRLPVGRPNRIAIEPRFPKSEAGAHLARDIENPNVIDACINLQRDAVTLRRNSGTLQIRELVGDHTELFSIAINPNEVQVCVSAT